MKSEPSDHLVNACRFKLQEIQTNNFYFTCNKQLKSQIELLPFYGSRLSSNSQVTQAVEETNLIVSDVIESSVWDDTDQYNTHNDWVVQLESFNVEDNFHNDQYNYEETSQNVQLLQASFIAGIRNFVRNIFLEWKKLAMYNFFCSMYPVIPKETELMVRKLI